MRGVKTMAPPTTMNLLALDESETGALVRRLGWPSYRTVQILRWLYQRRVRTISQMTDLSQADRAGLASEA
ncbi:MAG: rlmN, partial [Nitrospira sp.]|nr:rlmN [Nitrospira sp.]